MAPYSQSLKGCSVNFGNKEEGSSAADYVTDVTDVTDVSPSEEGRGKFGSGLCNGCNGCKSVGRGPREEGRGEKEVRQRIMYGM
ncbi:hypothetical protein [Tychonema sp. LEGE 06208]|uniref:hypothetical protein n=1 Tax=Tychonema sp. LEGE 06208 TaxID=1828663 RepID=UPI0018829892|nr:hypothetical protein [Tychonema sp. LEGE 06208]MBE9162637.1 hypothetical protein [Tychonema sp. LEGE 06208]